MLLPLNINNSIDLIRSWWQRHSLFQVMHHDQPIFRLLNFGWIGFLAGPPLGFFLKWHFPQVNRGFISFWVHVVHLKFFNGFSIKLLKSFVFIFLIFSMMPFHFVFKFNCSYTYIYIELIGFRISCDTVAFINEINFFSPTTFSHLTLDETSIICNTEWVAKRVFTFSRWILTNLNNSSWF